jgi:hypothetical protein
MKKQIFSALIGAGLAIGVAAPAMAHHSAAMFDQTKEVSIQGTVKEFQYTNPHSWLMVVAPGTDGKDVEWGFEAEGPSTLLRAGIKKSSLNPGDKVTVKAHPMKDGRPAGQWMNATKADGTVLTPRPAPIQTDAAPSGT